MRQLAFVSLLASLVVLGACAETSAESAVSAPVSAPYGQASEASPASPGRSGVPETRRVARTATLTLESDAPETVAEEARQAARRLEGFVSHAEIAPVSEHARRVTMTLRVPAARLETLLTSLRSLGAVRAESLGSKDVTLEVVDVEARLRNHEAREARFLELLKSATTLTHAIEIERELGRVRTTTGTFIDDVDEGALELPALDRAEVYRWIRGWLVAS